MASIVRFEKPSSQPWSAKQIVTMIKKGSIVFDHRVQRPLVWDRDRKSLLISSIIIGVPLNGFYANRISATKSYEMLEGKQRLTTIEEFIDGNFALRNVPPVKYDDGTEVEISKKTFIDLPEELQNEILNYSINILRFDDLTEEEKEDVFIRINNGKPVSEIEKTRIKSISKDEVSALSQHNLFMHLLTKAGKAASANIDMVHKTFVILFHYNPKKSSLSKQYVRNIMETVSMTEAQAEIIENVYTVLDQSLEKLKDENPKVYKELKTRSNFYSILPLVKNILGEYNWNITESVDALLVWALHFFGSEEGTSIRKEYNQLVLRGTTHAETVNRRFEIISEEYDSLK